MALDFLFFLIYESDWKSKLLLNRSEFAPLSAKSVAPASLRKIALAISIGTTYFLHNISGGPYYYEALRVVRWECLDKCLRQRKIPTELANGGRLAPSELRNLS